jgi:uncharacterized membrane protein YphA (DoxX/SURF4 family)
MGIISKNRACAAEPVRVDGGPKDRMETSPLALRALLRQTEEKVIKLYQAWWILRITYGLLFIIVGVDKFYNCLTDWHQFLGSTTLNLIPMNPDLLLKLFGVIQIGAGLLLFTRWYWYGILLIAALLVIIFSNLLSVSSSILIITHDVFMLIGISVLAQLSMIFRITDSFSKR